MSLESLFQPALPREFSIEHHVLGYSTDYAQFQKPYKKPPKEMDPEKIARKNRQRELREQREHDKKQKQYARFQEKQKKAAYGSPLKTPRVIYIEPRPVKQKAPKPQKEKKYKNKSKKTGTINPSQNPVYPGQFIYRHGYTPPEQRPTDFPQEIYDAADEYQRKLNASPEKVIDFSTGKFTFVRDIHVHGEFSHQPGETIKFEIVADTPLISAAQRINEVKSHQRLSDRPTYGNFGFHLEELKRIIPEMLGHTYVERYDLSGHDHEEKGPHLSNEIIQDKKNEDFNQNPRLYQKYTPNKRVRSVDDPPMSEKDKAKEQPIIQMSFGISGKYYKDSRSIQENNDKREIIDDFNKDNSGKKHNWHKKKHAEYLKDSTAYFEKKRKNGDYIKGDEQNAK